MDSRWYSIAIVSGLHYTEFYDTKKFTWSSDGNSCSATLVEVIFERVDKNNYSTYRPCEKDGIRCLYPDGISKDDLWIHFYKYKEDKDFVDRFMQEVRYKNF